VIQVQQAQPAGWKVIQSGGTAAIAFQPIGVGATPAKFKVCRSDPLGKQEREVTITATGMAYVTRTDTGTCS
jgi:type IV fimbrial biogenesis protein FimT